MRRENARIRRRGRHARENRPVGLKAERSGRQHMRVDRRLRRLRRNRREQQRRSETGGERDSAQDRMRTVHGLEGNDWRGAPGQTPETYGVQEKQRPLFQQRGHPPPMRNISKCSVWDEPQYCATAGAIHAAHSDHGSSWRRLSPVPSAPERTHEKALRRANSRIYGDSLTLVSDNSPS